MTTSLFFVNAVNSEAPAVASDYFDVTGEKFGGIAPQALVFDGIAQQTLVTESYTTEKKPVPVPIVAPASNFARTSSDINAPVAAKVDPGSAQEYAAQAVAGRGWGGDQFNCLVALWSRESGWRVNAHNSSSGAYGIPQALPGSKMASAGADWQTNAGTQIEWGLGYISGRYGTPCGAYAHSNDSGWY